MATPTANYGFVKAAPTENYDVAVVNANLDSIDLAIKARADAITALATRMTSAEGRLTELEAKAYAVIKPTVGQNFTNNVSTVVVWNSTVFSSGVTVELASNRIKITKAGLYVINCGLTWTPVVTGTRQAQINVNGTPVAASAMSGYTGGYNINACGITYPLDANDLVTLEAVQTSGATLATGPVDRSFLSVGRIGAQ